MTRGRIAIITPSGHIKTSTEFNGDMYCIDSGYGEEAFDQLESYVETEEDFEQMVLDFNGKYYQYEEKLTFNVDDDYFDMKNDYFGKWFSDYVYIKNLSADTHKIFTADGGFVNIEPDDVFVFNFGDIYATNHEEIEFRGIEEELSVMKENLSEYDSEKNYADIWNTCAEFDNTHHGVYLCDRITESDFVDEEIVDEMIKQNATSLSRLKCFIGDTREDSIYKLDGYGNLDNVERYDFEDLIDEVLNTVRAELPSSNKEALCM